MLDSREEDNKIWDEPKDNLFKKQSSEKPMSKGKKIPSEKSNDWLDENDEVVEEVKKFE